MKKLLFIVPILLLAFSSCTEKPKQNPETKKEIIMSPENHSVIVLKKQDGGSYTYFNVSENDKTFWIAVRKMEAVKGDTLFYSQSMEMKNFKSTALNKTFDSILFIGKISTSKKSINIPAHPKIKPETKTKVTIKRHKGSITIKKLFSKIKLFAGKTVKVEGKVTKINTQIMNRNWIHIQDGTSFEGKYDLLITSNVVVTKGSYVIMEGVVAIDKDFGAGYKYPLLVENSKLIKEIK